MSNSRAKAALDQLHNGNILIKMIPSEINERNESWHYTMKQLIDPKNNRPTKVLMLNADRNQIWDAKKQKWEYRTLHKKRGHKKDTVYIKPTAMTYPPQNGKMLYYYSNEIKNFIGIGCLIVDESHPEKIKEYINLGFDNLNKLHPELALIYIKDKYIFRTNVKSNIKPWIYNPKKHGYNEKKCDLISTTLTSIHNEIIELQSQSQTVSWNEIYCGPSYKSINFLFSSNTLIDRLNLLVKHNLLKMIYQVDLPLLIMDEHTEAKEYDLSQQLDDLAELININANSQDHQLVNKFKVILESIDFKNILKCYDTQIIEIQSAKCIEDKLCHLLFSLYKFNYTQKINEFFESSPIALNSKELNECLHTAIKKNDLVHVRKFIERGADPNCKIRDISVPNSTVEDNISALSLSVKLMNKRIFNYLIESKLEIKSLQDALLRSSRLQDTSFGIYVAEKLFLKKSFNPDVSMFENYTALYHATSRKNNYLVELICINGGNAGLIQGQINLRTSPINKALEMAKTDGDYQIVKTLITYANKTLTPKTRGFCIKTLIHHDQVNLARLIINSNEAIELKEYETELSEILKHIATLNISKKSKQVYALLFINNIFNEAQHPEDMMLHCRILMKSPPEVKCFLFITSDINKSFTCYNWNNEPVSSFFSQIIKLAKLRILHIIKQNDQLLITREIRDFLSTPRKSVFNFFQSPTSLQILDEPNSDMWQCMLKGEEEQTNTVIRKSYGLARQFS